MLGVILLLPLLARAATPEEDEARIEALIHAELHPSPPAQVVAAPPSGSANGAVPVPVPVQNAATAGAKTAVNQPPPEDPANLRFDALKNHIGAAVRLEMTDGSERFARVESSDAHQVSLSLASYDGAEFRFSVLREQIRRIELR